MITTQTEYVRALPEGGWRIGETRVSLASIVHCYWDGLSPEAIVGEFPTLTAEQVYGAIAWYLGHRDEADRFFAELAIRWEELRKESSIRNADIIQRMKNRAQALKQSSGP